MIGSRDGMMRRGIVSSRLAANSHHKSYLYIGETGYVSLSTDDPAVGSLSEERMHDRSTTCVVSKGGK